MQYRRFGRLDWQVSALGFGAMRLPASDGRAFSANVIEDEAIRMIRRAIDAGVNYVDTAYGYHDGRSEVVTGKALADGYREKVSLATKSPVWLVKEPGDFDKYLDEQLTRLGTDHIDCYLFHGLGRKRWEETVLKLDLLRRAEAALQDGRIRQVGFSFHGKAEEFPVIVDGYDRWTFCQIQYNYLDIENQAGVKGLRYAASKGLAVIVMEPLLGGKLARPPESVQPLFDRAPVRRSPAEWALQWLWNQPEVALVLSGMSTMAQVEENLAFAARSGVNTMTGEEQQFIAQVREHYQGLTPIPCTQCGYCLPCPQGVYIPGNLDLYNDAVVHHDFPASREVYQRFIGEPARAARCTQCRECEPKCPQNIAISEWLAKIAAAWEPGPGDSPA